MDAMGIRHHGADRLGGGPMPARSRRLRAGGDGPRPRPALANVSGPGPGGVSPPRSRHGRARETRDEAPLPLVHAASFETPRACSGPRASPRSPRSSLMRRGRADWRLASGLLQIHDFWEASHEAAQEADDLGETRVSAYWHGIAHRREPDPGNAAYWFRRVGRHPIVEDVSERVLPILEQHGDPELSSALLPQDRWDPLAFVAFCGKATTRRESSLERLARRLQRVEMLTLLEATAAVRK